MDGTTKPHTGCVTLPNGDCGAPGPCMHGPGVAQTTDETAILNTAWQEGWTLSTCGAYPDGTDIVQLQRQDSQKPDLPGFAEDRDAWEFVVSQARSGSAMHRTALEQVDRIERVLIEASCGFW